MSNQKIREPTSSQDGIPIGLEDIRRAAVLLGGDADVPAGRCSRIALHTPLVYSEPLSQQLNCKLWLKLENLQMTGSYKIRGAFNNIANLPDDRRQHGLVTASAGNHAQGVAAAASAFRLASKTTVFVPIGTPKVKQDNARAFGVEVRESGDNFDSAREAAYVEAARSSRSFIEPFDDWNTIAGQGTIGLEIAEDLPGAAGIIAPVGGGGLISGVAIAASEMLPNARVFGAQAAGSPSMILSLDEGAPVTLPYPPTTQIADGIKVSRPGDRTFLVCQTLLGANRFIAVPDIDTVGAAADLMVYAKVIAEGAGAIGLAALRAIQSGTVSAIRPFEPLEHVVVVVSGGNIDPSFSWRILYEQTVPNLMTLRVAMPDRPGELLRMLVPIARAHVNIIDVDVNRLDARPRMGERIVEVCVAVSSQSQADGLISSLGAEGYNVLVSRWQIPNADRVSNVLPSAIVPNRKMDNTVAAGKSEIPSPSLVPGGEQAPNIDLRVEGFFLTDQLGRRRSGNAFLPGEDIYVEIELRNAGTDGAPSGLVTHVFADSGPGETNAKDQRPDIALVHGSFLPTPLAYRYGSWPEGPRNRKFSGQSRSFRQEREGCYVARVAFDAEGRTGRAKETAGATVDYTISATVGDDEPRASIAEAIDLVVVNKRRALPADYVPSDLRVPQVLRTENFALKEPAAAAIELMFEQAAESSVRLRLLSGYRSFERQRELYDDLCTAKGIEVAEMLIARPGHSEHQTGLAVDLGDYEMEEADVTPAFAATAAGEWVQRHSTAFGFILRYPQDASALTGFHWEPWHFRFVGTRVAEAIHDEGLTLEAYAGSEGGGYVERQPIATRQAPGLR